MSIKFEIVVCVLILSLYIFHSWYYLEKKSFQWKNWKIYIYYLLLCCFLYFSYTCTSNFIRIILNGIGMTALNMLLFCNSFKKSIISTLITLLSLIVGELVFDLFIILLLKLNIVQDINTIFGSLYSNIPIAFFALLVLHTKKVRKIFISLTKKTEHIPLYQMSAYFGLLLMVFNIFLASIYFKPNQIYTVIISSLFISIYTFITIRSLKDKNEYIEIQTKNDELSDHLYEYKEILSKQRRRNHEGKTELIVIRDMIDPKNKKAINCINELIGAKEELEENFFLLCQKVPIGLQGIVYQKLLLADKKVQVFIDVSPKIESKNLEENLTTSEFLDICKIVGVFLGNAIDEVNEIIDNDKVICIQIYQERKTFILQIGNTYRPDTDFSKLGASGYTTKGKDHGQGLALVKELVAVHDNVLHESEVKGRLFFQRLKIKGLKF